MNPILLLVAGQLGDILLQFLTKKPELTGVFSGLLGGFVSLASQAAGETAEQTAKRRADHDAAVAQYGGAPPPASVPRAV
jgi:hypothetical protein